LFLREIGRLLLGSPTLNKSTDAEKPCLHSSLNLQSDLFDPDNRFWLLSYGTARPRLNWTDL